MKKLGIILSLLVATNAFAGVSDEDAYLLTNRNGSVPQVTQLGVALQKGTVQVAQGVYDFTQQGGGYSKDIGLGAEIPKKSIIKNAYYKILTAVTSDGSASISVGTSTASLTDIVSKTPINDLTQANTLQQGALFGDLGGASTFKLSSATSTVSLKMRVTGAPLTAGKIVFVVEYVKADQ